MSTASKPSAVAARTLAKTIVMLQPMCLHPDFMFEVNEYLEKMGLTMQAHQAGFRGTHIQIVKVQS